MKMQRKFKKKAEHINALTTNTCNQWSYIKGRTPTTVTVHSKV